MFQQMTRTVAVFVSFGLIALGSPADRTPKELLAIIRADGDKVAAEVLEELAGQRTVEALEALKKGTEQLTTPGKLRQAYGAFRHFKGVDRAYDKAVQFLAGRAADQRGEKGVHATLALGGLMPESADELVGIAVDPSGADHTAAALSALGPQMSQLDKKLLRKLVRSDVLEVRYEGLLEELQRVEDPGRRAQRATGLHKKKGAAERLVAVEWLASNDHPQRFELLAQSLDDAYPPVARKAIASLVSSAELRAVELLIGRLEGAGNAEVWHLTRALGRMTGQPHGRRTESWVRWWEREGADFQLPKPGTQSNTKEEQSPTRATFYGLPIHDDHVVFAVDTSDSMKAKVARTDGSRRIDVAKKELRRAIESFGKDATFDLVNFGKSAWAWQGELVAARKRTRKEALEWIDRLDLSWGTEVHGGLREAFRDPAADVIVFLTDGDPQLSEMMSRPTIQRLVRQWNRTRHTTIDCLTIGTERAWLRTLAEQSGGRYRMVN